MDTNANSKLLAAILADAKLGTFTSLLIRKQGDTRGRGADKKLYGDDQVITVMLTGFKYETLVQKSLDGLEGIKISEIVEACAEKGHTVHADEVKEALVELQESYTKTLAGENKSTSGHVYEPLVADGEIVRGAKVYRCVKDKKNPETDENYLCQCFACSGDAKAPKDGQINLYGLRIWSKVLEPAANGPIPESNSAPKTLAKNEITSRLPISRFVSYRLAIGGDFILKAGGTAAVESTSRGFVVDDSIMDVLTRLSKAA